MASSGVGTEDGWDVSDLTADGAQYPDGVDVPLDIPAKQRFQRCRSLICCGLFSLCKGTRIQAKKG